MVDRWATYVDEVRRLGDLRAAQREQTAQRAAQTQASTEAIGTLRTDLGAQHDDFLQLARDLRYPAPDLSQPASLVGTPSDVDALTRSAEQELDHADSARERVARWATRPPLLPDATPVWRNAAIYSAWAFVAAVIQFGLLGPAELIGYSFTDVVAWVCCGLPTLAVFAGYLTIVAIAKPRVGDTKLPRSPRLGAAICFGTLPVLWLLYKLVTAALFI